MSQEQPSLISEEAMDELRQPYMESYNQLAFYDLSENPMSEKADFNADWEDNYLITVEARDRTLRNELVNRRYEETAEARRIRMEDRENRRAWLQREAYTNSLIESALLNALQSSYEEPEPYTESYTEPPYNFQQPKHKPNPNYKPQYTKPWTSADLAAVGAYSSKPSTAQKVYQECYAKQDRAWHASIKSQIKWKK